MAEPEIGADVTSLMQSRTSEEADPSSEGNASDWRPWAEHPIAKGLLAAGASMPLAKALAEEVATNPNLWKAGKLIGELVGGIEGAIKGGPLGMAGGMWVGGKAGWRLANVAQRLAPSIIKAMEVAGPVASVAGATLTMGDIAAAMGAKPGIQPHQGNRAAFLTGQK